MKTLRLFTIALLAFAAAFAPSTEAQSYNQGGLFASTPLASTVNIAATSTNTTMYLTNGATGTFTKAPIYGAFQPVFRLTGAGTSPCVATFDTSVDGTYWNAATFTISVTANGTNWVTAVSNQTLGSVGFVRLAGITNPNATAITNLIVVTAGKTP